MRRLALSIAACLAGCVILAAPLLASAAPMNGFVLTFNCSNGVTVTTDNPVGHSTWPPGILVGGGGVLKPVAFSGSNTLYNPDGSIASFDTFSGQQANGTVEQNNPQDMVNCFNSTTYTAEQADLPPGDTLTVDITIIGFLTGTV